MLDSVGVSTIYSGLWVSNPLVIVCFQVYLLGGLAELGDCKLGIYLLRSPVAVVY